MNNERLLAVADAIEREEIKGMTFNMGSWLKKRAHCNTTACIAGHVVALFDPQMLNWDYVDIIEVTARNLLATAGDDDRLELTRLFYGSSLAGNRYNLDKIPKEMAAIAIRRLVETGVTDWDEAKDIYACKIGINSEDLTRVIIY